MEQILHGTTIRTFTDDAAGNIITDVQNGVTTTYAQSLSHFD